MKRMTLTTQITLPDDHEKFLYQYLEANGFGKQTNVAKNTGGFDHEDQSEGITVRTTCNIEDVDADTQPSQES